MPLYVGDYLADTAGLSAEEHGAYLLLIMNYWASGKPLPDDDGRLARIAACSDERWLAVRKSVDKFFKVGRGVWKHARIEAEMARVNRIIEAKRRAGKARRTNDLPAHAGHMLQHNANTTPVTTPTKKVSKKEIDANLKNVGGALRARGAARVDFADPVNRYSFACRKITESLSKRMSPVEAQTLVLAADDGDAKALTICRAEARRGRWTYVKPTTNPVRNP